ncbi:DNA polymerase V [Methylohalomonas lacus]|uniref:DNA polymerase V n=1 Tax=Methylohalomonas lacus TaxID=398773 RepID=A0AAE3L0B5_9GAMM|nr:translesion error-prone DNA polymerase V autoproteolytic subunit [Methylohalomonas lacus]MCS3902199.1 DNA polymerase V [Methylohalomonas lacus]
MSPRGGQRPGAGRKPGSNDYGEPTRPVRVPTSLVPELQAVLAAYRNRQGRAAADTAELLAPAANPQRLRRPLFAFRVPAGFPSPAEDYVEKTIDLNEQLIQHKEATFFVRVKGDSMIDAGIHDGDTLVVDRAIEPKHRHIVLAVIDGQLTVKRLIKHKGEVWLHAENAAYAPIKLDPETGCDIWGVVKHAIHSF